MKKWCAIWRKKGRRRGKRCGRTCGEAAGDGNHPGTRRGERCLRENTGARFFHRGRDLPVCVKDSPAGGALQWGEDCHIVIVGNASHPEVKGIKSWSNAEDTRVIGTREEAEKYDASHGKKVCIVSQTTFNYNKFQELVEIIKEKGYDIIVLNTICNATEERQTEARAIAEQVDAMIVIGGRNSSNTQKLFEICKKTNAKILTIYKL